MLKKTIVIFLLSILTMSSTAIAIDECKDILSDGIFKETKRREERDLEDFAKDWLCNNWEIELNKDNAFIADFFLSDILNIKGGVDSNLSGSWKKENCVPTQKGSRFKTSSLNKTREANDSIVNAWLECMKLRRWDISQNISVEDIHGIQATFKIAVLGRAYNWAIGDCKRVVEDEEEIDMKEKFMTAPWKKAANEAIEIIAVGMASCGYEQSRGRNNAELKDAEIKRARKRAKQLLKWMTESELISLASSQTRRILNLGMYTDEYCNEGTPKADQQRPITIVLVTEINDNSGRFDYKSALRQAVRQHSAFPDIDKYSNFELDIQ